MAKRLKSAPHPLTSRPHLRSAAVSNSRHSKIRLGDDLVKCVASAARRSAIHFEDGDILVFAQKIVSKAEGTLVGWQA